jgi:hypothetical protein
MISLPRFEVEPTIGWRKWLQKPKNLGAAVVPQSGKQTDRDYWKIMGKPLALAFYRATSIQSRGL